MRSELARERVPGQPLRYNDGVAELKHHANGILGPNKRRESSGYKIPSKTLPAN
jgi:hypothetical protein